MGISGNINSSDSNETITLQELKASNEILREKLSREEEKVEILVKRVEILVKECARYNDLIFKYRIATRKMKSEFNELKRKSYEASRESKTSS